MPIKPEPMIFFNSTPIERLGHRQREIVDYVIRKGYDPIGIKQHYSPDYTRDKRDRIPRSFKKGWIERPVYSQYNLVILSNTDYIHYGDNFVGEPPRWWRNLDEW